ncbi:MAG: ferredoxin [Candidatus Omnitrophota bacterium]
MKVIIDSEACIGCGLCVQVAQEIYEMQDDKAVSKVDEIPADREEDAQSGADQCPVSAITVS